MTPDEAIQWIQSHLDPDPDDGIITVYVLS